MNGPARAATDPVAPGASPLDRFLPRADVRERHEILVHAPAAVVLDAARQFDLESIPAVRAIFSTRAWIMGSRPPRREPAGLLGKAVTAGGRRVTVGGQTALMDQTGQGLDVSRNFA